LPTAGIRSGDTPPAGPVRLAGRAVLATQSDDRLVALARRGSEPAFEAIVHRYRDPLGRYCRRLVPAARVDDVLQHAFLRTYTTLRSDRRELNLRPWLFRVTHNAALDALRREARTHDQLDESLDGVERPDQALERKVALATLVAGIAALPERQRSALVLRELEGRSYEEIERELGLKGGALRQLLHRARNNLRAAATAVTPAAVFLRPELPFGLATGAGAAKAGAVLATTAVIGGVALTTGPDERDADAAESKGGGGSVVSPRPVADPGHPAKPRSGGSQHESAGREADPRPTARRGERRSAGEHRAVRGGPAPGHPSPGTGDRQVSPPAGDDDALGDDDSTGGDDSPAGATQPGGDDDSAAGAPTGGADDDAGEGAAPLPVPVTPPGSGDDDGEGQEGSGD
jgi:RNA polymerase sigma factor (sigma-70 family)